MSAALLQYLMMHVVANRRPWALRYALTALLIAAVTGLKFALEETLPGFDYIFVFPSVAFAALALRTGLFATLLGGLATHYVLVEPHFSFDFAMQGAIPALIAFFLGGSIIAGVVTLLYAAIDRLQAAVQDASLQSEQRKALSQEMNHRVKNNLQILAAMIRMQAGSDPGKASLQNAADRIATMGHIHDQLFRLEDSGAHLESRKFIADLCASLQHSLIGHRPIRLELDADSAAVALSQATNIGLLINEAVTNSVKHGFPDGMSGMIAISFRVAGGMAALTISDDGRGLASGATPGFGSRMIDVLARQLGGELQRDSSAGTRLTVTFPLLATHAPA